MTTINYGKTDVDGRGDGTSACPVRRQAAPGDKRRQCSRSRQMPGWLPAIRLLCNKGPK